MAQSLTTDERFDKVDAQLSEMNRHMDESFAEMNKQLDRITTAVVQGFERVDKKLEDKANKTDMQRVYDYLDKIIKQQEINDDERLVMGHQLDRLNRWVQEVADKIGYTLAT